MARIRWMLLGTNTPPSGSRCARSRTVGSDVAGAPWSSPSWARAAPTNMASIPARMQDHRGPVPSPQQRHDDNSRGKASESGHQRRRNICETTAPEFRLPMVRQTAVAAFPLASSGGTIERRGQHVVDTVLGDREDQVIGPRLGGPGGARAGTARSPRRARAAGPLASRLQCWRLPPIRWSQTGRDR